MNNGDVTNIMDWLAEHWGWLGAFAAFLLGAVGRFWKDHMRIRDLKEDMSEVKERVAKMENIEMKRVDTLARIEEKLDYVVTAVKGNTEDIKDLIRGGPK